MKAITLNTKNGKASKWFLLLAVILSFSISCTASDKGERTSIALPDYIIAGLIAPDTVANTDWAWSGSIEGLSVTVYTANGESHSVMAVGNSVDDLFKNCSAQLLESPAKFSLAGNRIQIDIIETMRSIPKLRTKIDPGHTGLLVLKDSKVVSWLLPSEVITRRGWSSKEGFKYKRMLKILQQRATKSSAVSTGDYFAFNSKSFIQDQAALPKLSQMYRANVLMPRTIDAAQIKSSCISMGEYFVKTVSEQGQFAYKHYPITQSIDQKSYNHLRHCGCIYSIFQLYGLNQNKELLDTGIRALDYILKFVPPKQAGESYRYLLDIKRKGRPVKIKLGGAALLLLALCEYEEQTQQKTYRPLMDELSKFILFMQKENGDFYARYDQEKRAGMEDSFSIYYPGEAALGLIRYYRLTKDVKLLDSAEKALHFLCSPQHKKHPKYISAAIDYMDSKILIDSWRMMALQEFYQIKAVPKFAEECLLLGNAMIFHQYQESEECPTDYVGGPHYKAPKVIASGSRKEGLGAAYKIAHVLKRDTQKYLKAIAESSWFAINQQYRPINSFYLPDQTAIGGIRTALFTNQIRNDCVQHNLSGLISYYGILLDK